MDTLGASAHEECDYLSLFDSAEELIDLTPQVQGHYPISREHDFKHHLQILSFSINPVLDTDFMGISGSSHYPLVIPDSNLQTVSQESSSIASKSNGYVVSTCQGIDSNKHIRIANEISAHFDIFSYAFNMGGNNSDSFASELSGTLMEEGACLKEMHSETEGSLSNNQPEDFSTPPMQLQHKSSSRRDSIHARGLSICTDVSQNMKKRCRTSRDLSPRKKIKGQRNPENLLSDDNDGDDSNVRPTGSSTCSLEDGDSGELNGKLSPPFKASITLAENGNIGKIKATRGSATDPQSLYARKRRARINERLRILQNLVPHGSKVDISTMLEEAVHYVKFLQLQIKLLSSDELWRQILKRAATSWTSNCFVVSSSDVETEKGIGSNNHMPLANEKSSYFDAFSGAFYKGAKSSNSFVSELSGTLMEQSTCLKEMHSERRGYLGNNQPEDVSMPLMQLQFERKSSRSDNIYAGAGHSTCIDVSDNTKKRTRTSIDLRKKKNQSKECEDAYVEPNKYSSCNQVDGHSGKLNGDRTPPFKASTALTENGNIGMTTSTKGSANNPQSLFERMKSAALPEKCFVFLVL